MMAAPLAHQGILLNRILSLCRIGVPSLQCRRFRQSHMRHRSTSVTHMDSSDIAYPAIKPKFPPGDWGAMDRKHAWMWTSLQDKLLNLSTAHERMDVFLSNETDAVLLERINDHPASLAFREYATKTVMSKWTNENEASTFYSNNVDSSLIDEMVAVLKNELSDHFYMENEFIARDYINHQHLKNADCKRLIRCITDTFLSRFSSKVKHLQDSQSDENAKIRALWDVHGIGREDNSEKLEYSTIEEILTIIDKNDERIHSEVEFDSILRNSLPLQQVLPLSESSEMTAPTLEFRLNSYGHSHQKKKKIKSIFAGHKAGDPCEFGLLGFLSTCDMQKIEESMNEKVAEDSRLALGITGAFTWLAAQAYNQGFSPVIDLSYPLTSQVILTDGDRFSFLLYQLNTLALWRDGNKLNNLCWHTQEMPLYHSIEDGKVKEFNDDVLRLLAQMFLVCPADRGYDMKPTLSVKDMDLHLKSDFIPEKIVVEEVIEEEKYIV